MASDECAEFLRRTLPGLGLRWSGFRRVRGQVCKRIRRRCTVLGLSGPCAYGRYLETHPSERRVLDALCRVTVSRFYRDREVFDRLREDVVPARARALVQAGESTLRAWSVGCGSGEEPYTLTLLWHFDLERRFPGLGLQVTATDVDEALLRRAARACYKHGTLRDLPPEWLARAFTRVNGEYCLERALCAGVRFERQDVRRVAPGGSFHWVLCRNLVFTYFEAELQKRVLERLTRCLAPGGVLVIGRRESLPAGVGGVDPIEPALGIYARSYPK
ncbi:MAG: methyltransferase domain-containing protein [Gammaproteobacteria bacterium]|nr:methyltransferase domain-containing protein [Gammaproteobacteria bacterium]NIR84067.1 methyltransferase domain-containing protein [Gammaproteobacteria bacterium]NIR89211.1 methyltransferase domain-containing protein [Gammaproteobacteria bacterium]NIU05013.1 methyltransferase domain-containing protein [Gammaproteobacteria bacterium]NIV52179.1 methyltransferase domain-containing protein [Gammaproteobacteria bacterium]